jgi:hypothetical protein
MMGRHLRIKGEFSIQIANIKGLKSPPSNSEKEI